jgi:hypothetical protein
MIRGCSRCDEEAAPGHAPPPLSHRPDRRRVARTVRRRRVPGRRARQTLQSMFHGASRPGPCPRVKDTPEVASTTTSVSSRPGRRARPGPAVRPLPPSGDRLLRGHPHRADRGRLCRHPGLSGCGHPAVPRHLPPLGVVGGQGRGEGHLLRRLRPGLPTPRTPASSRKLDSHPGCRRRLRARVVTLPGDLGEVRFRRWIWTKCGQRPHRGCAVSDRAAGSAVVRRGGPGVGRRMGRHQVIVELIWATTTHPSLWVRSAGPRPLPAQDQSR